jgi:hypothetical protein
MSSQPFLAGGSQGLQRTSPDDILTQSQSMSSMNTLLARLNFESQTFCNHHGHCLCHISGRARWRCTVCTSSFANSERQREQLTPED